MSQVIDNLDTLVTEVLIYSPPHTQLAVLRRVYKVHIAVGAGVTFTDVAADFSAAQATMYKNLIANTASFRGVRVRRIWPANLDAWGQFTGDAGAGISGPNSLPLQSAGLITFGGAEIGRKGEGRQYVPFPASLDNDASGRPTAGYLTALGVLGANIVSDRTVTVGANSVSLWHINFNRIVHTFKLLPNVVRVGGWATQKRRGDYGRANRLPF